MMEIDGIYAILLLISTSITLYLTFYSWNKRSNPDALYSSFLMLAVSIWPITGAFEMTSITVSTKVLWSQMSYLGIVFVGPPWLLFSLSYTSNDPWLKTKFTVRFPEDPDFKETNSLGLRIVNSLTKQIEGNIKLDRTNGTKFTIEFKEENYENDDS